MIFIGPETLRLPEGSRDDASIVPYAGFCLPGRAAQRPISGSYTGATRRGASETPPAGGSDLIGPETLRQPEDLRDKAGREPEGCGGRKLSRRA